MATFLTTPRMNPALRARVERAVSHRARARHNAAAVGLQRAFASREPFRMARLLPLAALAAVIAMGYVMFRHARTVLLEERNALLATLEQRRIGLPPAHALFRGETDHLITETASDSPPPDSVDASLKAPGALDAWLRRPAVYVHGNAAELRDSQKIDDAAAASDKDAFLVCLMTPPPSDSEHDLLAKVKGVYFAGAKVGDQTANVYRLAEARAGLAVLGPAFEAAALVAEDVPTLRKLRKDLEAAPVEAAKKAAAAELLVVVADRTAKTSSRDASVALMDLAGKKTLARWRVRMDVHEGSPAAAMYRDSLEGCALALEVRKRVGE